MSEVVIEFVVVQGEKPTEEEIKEIHGIMARVYAKRRQEKWLFLSKKEALTPEEQEWMEKEARRKKNFRPIRQAKWLYLKSKETLTEEERIWLEREDASKKRVPTQNRLWAKNHPEKTRQMMKKHRDSQTEEQKTKIYKDNAARVKARREKDPAFAFFLSRQK